MRASEIAGSARAQAVRWASAPAVFQDPLRRPNCATAAPINRTPGTRMVIARERFRISSDKIMLREYNCRAWLGDTRSEGQALLVGLEFGETDAGNVFQVVER